MAADSRHGIEELTGFAMDIIHQVGEKSLSYYGRGKPNIKFDEVLITEAELSLTDFFESQLKSRFSSHHLFKDNFENEAYSHEGERYLWVFDPIDGVANFQAGIPIWGMSLALIENFWPVFGVFFMPATGDLFHAQAGKTAFWGNKQIKATGSIDSINDESLLLTYSRFHSHFRCNFPGKVRALGCTSAHICYVAMGRADAAIVANETFQDLAAARVIIEAAGGKICGVDGCDFHIDDYLNGQKIDGNLLVTAPDKFTQVQRCLKPIN